MYEPCLVCGGGLEKSKLPGLLRCLSCGFVTADVALSHEQLAQLYTADYFCGQEYKDYVSERPLIEKHFRQRLFRLLPFIKDPKQKQLFEIGCAYGFFLEVARDSFSSVEGIDISRDAVDFAARNLGLTVHAGDFLEYKGGNTMDVVCLWDTVEHLQHPDLYIRKAAGQMKPGGVLALTTGDIGSLVARIRGPRWRQIHPPTHLHYFSKRSLTRLLHQEGFRIVFCGYEGVYRSVDTAAYIILNIKHNLPKLYSYLKRLHILNWNFYLNLYDILFVVAERS